MLLISIKVWVPYMTICYKTDDIIPYLESTKREKSEQGLSKISVNFSVKGNFYFALQWRHNGRDGVSNHQSHDCLLNRLFRRRSKKTSKLRVTGLYAANSPVTGEFAAQRARNAENVSICWRHHYTNVNQIIWFPVISDRCYQESFSLHKAIKSRY